MMTEKDRQLIAKAKQMSYIYWGEVSDMASQADTKEARDQIRQIAIRLHHKEEASIGII